MKPSGQPRLAPNGGSSLKPAWFLLAIPGVMMATIFPPLTLLAIPPIVIFIAKRVERSNQARAEERRHQRAMADYYRRREAAQWCEQWNNPGWRL